MLTIQQIINKHVNEAMATAAKGIAADLQAMFLGGGETAAPAKRKPGRPAKTAALPNKSARKPRKPAQAKPLPEDIAKLMPDLETFVSSAGAEGCVLNEIVNGIGQDKAVVSKLLAIAIESGKLTKTGQARGTKYLAVAA